MKRSTATEQLKEAACAWAEAFAHGTITPGHEKALHDAANALYEARLAWEAWQRHPHTGRPDGRKRTKGVTHA